MGQALILVDTPDNQLRHVAQTLTEQGYEPVAVQTQAELLDKLDTVDCQLVFLNLQHPEVTELCDAMRNSMAGAIVPVIFLGCGEPGEHSIRSPADALSAGGDYYFAAPFDLGRIVAKVRTYVGLSRQDHAAVVDVGDLDQPARHRLPAGSDADPLAGASDAVLAEICNREAEMAEMLRDGPAPMAHRPKPVQHNPASMQPQQAAPGSASAATDDGATEAEDDGMAQVPQVPKPPATRPAPRKAKPPAERPVSITYRPLAPASGSLKPEYDLARLFCDALRQRVTGRVSLENGHAQCTVFFLEGAPVKVQSLLPEHRLEEYLWRTKKITAAQYQQVRLRGLRRTPQVKAFLLEKNMLGADVLEEALHAQLKEQLIELFIYTTASFSYSPQLCDVGVRLHLRLDMRNIVMQAIRKHYVLEQLIGRVGSADTYLAVRPEQQVQLDALTLTGAELALLSLLDGRRSLHEVASLSGLKMERVYQAVYGMLCVEAAQVARGTEALPEEAIAAAEQAATGRILEKLHQVRMHDYFQILEVHQEASMQDIEAAYLSTSQKFSPAAFASGVQNEQRQNIAEIQTVLREAHSVLRDPQLRPLYGRHVA